MTLRLAIASLSVALATTCACAEPVPEAAAGTAVAAVEADPEPADPEPKPELTRTTICALIDESAARHRLPIDFFTRLIWKESRFRQNAVSPKGAQGIAQFMPGTAALRGLSDPFDPLEAIPASARYLRDLADRFGNLGLAAAAYNAGEKRLADWRAGVGGLPYETRDYVVSITGLSAEDWNAPGAALKPAERGLPPDERPPGTCLGVAALLARPGAGMEIVASYPKADWAPWGVQVAGQLLAQSRHGELCGPPEAPCRNSRRPAADGGPRLQPEPRQCPGVPAPCPGPDPRRGRRHLRPAQGRRRRLRRDEDRGVGRASRPLTRSPVAVIVRASGSLRGKHADRRRPTARRFRLSASARGG